MDKYDVVIVGGGISGLSALHYLRQTKNNLKGHLFESEQRLGGTIGTDRINGYSLDWGPNGFLDREPLTLQLCDQLGLADKLERAGANVSQRFILRKGKLREVPMSPQKFLLSNILSPLGKLRVLMEPLISKKKEISDESIYDFVRRRIGRRAADYLVQPMVSGIYGGVAQKMSLKACFPIMEEMEAEFGSLFKAMIAKSKKAKKEGKKSGGPSGPGGWLTSFESGLDVLTNRMAELYGEYITTGIDVTRIEKDENKYLLTLKDSRIIESNNVILALPTYRAADILKELSVELAEALSNIVYAPISVICLGYPAKSIKRDLNGFGFLVPGKEKRNILGSIWTSSIFKDRAPQNFVQFRSMIGGDGDHLSHKLSDKELVSKVVNDLDSIIGIRGEPDLIKIYRWSKGIPQYHIGHSKKVEIIEQELDRLGNIFITGNALYGIGLNDCVKQSHKVVDKINVL